MDTEASSEIVTLVLIGTLGAMIIAGSLVFFVVLYNKRMLNEKHERIKAKLEFQKQLLSATFAVEERERKDIAQNLHDDIGALLSLIRINESQIVKEVGADSKSAQLVATNKEFLSGISNSVRNITNRLYSPVLSKFGLIEAFKDLFGRFNETEELSVEFHTQGDFERLDQNHQIQIYRSVLEVVNNSLKHSGSNEFRVEMMIDDAECNIKVISNGEGISHEQYLEYIETSSGLGLSSLQSRIDSMNGEILFVKGTGQKNNHVTISVPYEENKNSHSR